MSSLISTTYLLRTPIIATHFLKCSFHTTSPARASILFALSALSNSRETQHFAKITRLPRMEHSPPLKLIKTSEVDAFPLPTPPRPVMRPPVRDLGSGRSVSRLWDQRALQVGRVILADQARQMHRLMRSLASAKRRAAMQGAVLSRDRLAWQKERQRMRGEMRAAGMWILISIATATALATWRFWPERDAVPDSAELGRKIAARAAAAMPLPKAISVESSTPVSIEPTITAPVTVPRPSPSAEVERVVSTSPFAPMGSSNNPGAWWKGIFWKQ